jgi:hypothetical protein
MNFETQSYKTRSGVISLTGIVAMALLLASCGSDFHQPGQPWSELGQHSMLPEHCTPIWQSF